MGNAVETGSRYFLPSLTLSNARISLNRYRRIILSGQRRCGGQGGLMGREGVAKYFPTLSAPKPQ
jgi:hypothetical protein